MLYQHKHPNAVDEDEVEYCIIKTKTEYPCEICKQATYFAELNFEAPICSDECCDALYEEYDESGRR